MINAPNALPFAGEGASISSGVFECLAIFHWQAGATLRVVTILFQAFCNLALSGPPKCFHVCSRLIQSEYQQCFVPLGTGLLW